MLLAGQQKLVAPDQAQQKRRGEGADQRNQHQGGTDFPAGGEIADAQHALQKVGQKVTEEGRDPCPDGCGKTSSAPGHQAEEESVEQIEKRARKVLGNGFDRGNVSCEIHQKACGKNHQCGKRSGAAGVACLSKGGKQHREQHCGR